MRASERHNIQANELMSVYIIILSCINGNTIQRILYYYDYTDVVLLQTRLHCLFSANLPLVYFIQDEKNQILATNIWLNMVSETTVPCTLLSSRAVTCLTFVFSFLPTGRKEPNHKHKYVAKYGKFLNWSQPRITHIEHFVSCVLRKY